MNTKISIIIITFNSADYIQQCLRSVLLAKNIQCEIFVVDNNSSDSTVEIIESDFPSVHLIANPKNVGFGAANNQAIKLCSSDLVLLLNPDTRIFPDTIRLLADHLQANPCHAMVGPYIENEDGSLQDSVSYKYPSQKLDPKATSNLPGEIASLLGACILVRKSILDRLNGFDEDFFLYGEDQDLCIRARKLGYSIGYLETARIMHVGGTSEVSTPRLEVVAKKLSAEFLFYSKHYSIAAIEKIIYYKKRLYGFKLLLLALSFSQRKHAKRELYRFILDWLSNYQRGLIETGSGKV
jgi:GT2 family glycosyltransferase